MKNHSLKSPGTFVTLRDTTGSQDGSGAPVDVPAGRLKRAGADVLREIGPLEALARQAKQ